jgi:hypothetical protein
MPGDAAGDASGDLAPLPPAIARRLVSGRARLVGTHRNACSHQPGSASRWCAFSQPGMALGKTDLWVLDVGKAMTADVPCNGMDAGCLRLSTDLWTGTPNDPPYHPYSHHFFGDTLIFYANTAPDVQPYKGPIYAWRPGWATARQITGPNGFSCDGHPATDVAVCLENVTTATGAPAQYDLHAGRLGTNALPLVAHILPARADGAFQTDAAFTPAGDYFAYSAGNVTTNQPETLYVWKTDELPMPDKRVMVAASVSRWSFSADSKRWYWFRDYNYPALRSGVQSLGTLATADFPGGGNEKVIAMGVNTFQALGDAGVDRGVAFLDGAMSGLANYKMVSDPGKPAAITMISGGVGGFVLSPDLRYSVLQTQFNTQKSTSDVVVIKNDGGGRCALAPMATADDLLLSPFLPHSGLVFWTDNINATTGLGEGWVARPDGCADRRKFADAIDFWFAAGDDGLIFSDTSTALVATIRYAKLAGGQWPAAGPVTIREKAGWVYAPLVDRDRVVYYVDQGTADDGLYVYGPIGFGRP